ncbi:T9SS type A sorting domain-containing protein [Lutimonas halocynthiae]|uniref:T9SS type A sorting domain-containing protein n=1 Tax=Lutimonas halocynthiae TaxID=1446477 RepID=UPI0025B3A4AB|nr:T9SS type A sorting domain-containing protein [Lutimonas halocynthiae]
MKKYLIVLFFILFAGLSSISAQVTTVNNAAEKESIDNFVLNDAVTMYPNPVRNFLIIRSSYPITRIQVYSLLGDLVKDELGNDVERINMSSLNSGIYMIKIYSNQFFVTKKLIKK